MMRIKKGKWSYISPVRGREHFICHRNIADTDGSHDLARLSIGFASGGGPSSADTITKEDFTTGQILTLTNGDSQNTTNGGFVGIGTTNPQFPIHVYADYTPTGGEYNYIYTWFNNTNPQSHWQGTRNIIAKFTGGSGLVWSTNGFMTSSDMRIKKNIVEINDGLSLQKLRDISCCSYNYIDTKKTNKTQIGFIAQQVKEHLPDVITIQKEIIPNEMRILDVSWNGLDMSSNLQDVSGVKYRFYVSNDISGNDEVMKEIVGNKDNTFTFDASYNNVFCYGKEVDDFIL